MRKNGFRWSRGFRALASGVLGLTLITFGALTASAATATDTGFTVPTVGKIKAGQAGVIFDNTIPLDWTGHLTAGGFGTRVVPKITDWFALPACTSTAQIYCISKVTVGGTALAPMTELPAIDNNALARSTSNIRTGIVSRWASSDGKTLLAVNSYATFRCDLNCALPDVSQVATDVRAYKVVKSSSYHALGYWDVYSALMGGHPEDQQLFRECAWLDKGQCGKIILLPAKQISVGLQLPVSLRTSFPGPDVLAGHFDNFYLNESVGGPSATPGAVVRTVEVSATPAAVGYFAGILNAPLPTWAGEGRTTILNPEDGNSLPITSNLAPTGANPVWQFSLNETYSANDAGSCLGNIHGVVAGVGSNSSSLGSLDWVATTEARFSTQDYPKNLNLSTRLVQDRVLLRNDFAGCITSNSATSAQNLGVSASFQLGTTNTNVAIALTQDSNNSHWLVKDLVYPAQSTGTINIDLALTPAAATATGNMPPAPLLVAKQAYSIQCVKKSGSNKYTAKATGVNPKCPAGYTKIGYVN